MRLSLILAQDIEIASAPCQTVASSQHGIRTALRQLESGHCLRSAVKLLSKGERRQVGSWFHTLARRRRLNRSSFRRHCQPSERKLLPQPRGEDDVRLKADGASTPRRLMIIDVFNERRGGCGRPAPTRWRHLHAVSASRVEKHSGAEPRKGA